MAIPQFSVRSRILAVILIVTALGMSIAGGAAHLSQGALTYWPPWTRASN